MLSHDMLRLVLTGAIGSAGVLALALGIWDKALTDSARLLLAAIWTVGIWALL